MDIYDVCWMGRILTSCRDLSVQFPEYVFFFWGSKVCFPSLFCVLLVTFCFLLVFYFVLCSSLFLLDILDD